jgi:hypothetical protein
MHRFGLFCCRLTLAMRHEKEPRLGGNGTLLKEVYGRDRHNIAAPQRGGKSRYSELGISDWLARGGRSVVPMMPRLWSDLPRARQTAMALSNFRMFEE